MKNDTFRYVREMLSETKGVILLLALGFSLGFLVRTLFAFSEINQLQREHDSYRDLVDSCFIRPFSKSSSHTFPRYDDEGNYQYVFRKPDAR